MKDGEEIRFIEMFSGIRGVRLGLERANRNSYKKENKQSQIINSNSGYIGNTARRSFYGKAFRCVWANDNNKYANQTSRKNYPDDNLIEADIRDIKANSIPDFDLLTAGFPCQAFSIAGKRKATKEARGTLFTHIVRVAAHKRPKLLLLENVKGILSSESGRTFAIILRTLANLGYLLEWQVLNSKHFGVPQNRERVFIIGHLRGESGCQIFPIGQNGEKVTKSRTVARTLQGGEHSGGLHSNMTGLISKSVRSGGRSSLDRHSWDLVQVGELYEGSQLRVYSPEGYAPTLHKSGGNTEPLIANYVDTSGWLRKMGRHETGKHGLTDYRIRRLTPTECERLQGFPDGWTEGVSDTQRYKCLGNAVTTNVIEFLGRQMLSIV